MWDILYDITFHFCLLKLTVYYIQSVGEDYITLIMKQ